MRATMKKTGKAILWVAVSLLPGCLVYSQTGKAKQVAEFDHATVHVRDLQKSTEFYEKVMGLEKISEPFKDGQHVWFRAGAHEQLHVVGGAKEAAKSDIAVHMAFRVVSLPEFMAHLDQMQVQYRSFQGEAKTPSARPDGVKQIYLQDADGYWIEVNDDKY
jgi:lactoylglutathione lyase